MSDTAAITTTTTTSTILEDITQALEAWSQRILSAENRIKRVTDFQQNLVAGIHRQVLDGFISEQDSFEFEYVTDLWVNLYKAFLCRSAGAEFADRDVFTYLIELYGLKQISKEFCVLVALQLCRTNS